MVDKGDVLKQEDLDDILFDDDTFSTSKRYFWAINFIHEAVKLLDNSVQQWAQYKRHCVTPWKTNPSSGEAYWREQSQRVLAMAEQQAEDACEELKLLRQEFQERLERITVMRDGVSILIEPHSI
jgi:3-mercaptopyruvate sulfurtransferase SseA